MEWNLRPGCESAPRQSERLRPKSTRRMCELYHVSNCRHEDVELRVVHHQWRSHLQNHEVISANLRQKSRIAKQTHYHDLAEHSWMYRAKSLIRDAQAKLAGSLKFDAHQQSHTADFLYHFKIAERFGQPRLQIVAGFDRAPPQLFVLQNLQRGTRRSHRKTVFAECGRMHEGSRQ